MGIKHRADSSFPKFRVLNKLCLGGQVPSSECPTFHTRDRYRKSLNIGWRYGVSKKKKRKNSSIA